MADRKLIKRYANRKLYDTERSTYVTLDEIAEMVRGELDVTIVDNKTGEDLTSVTLAQIILEQEKRDKAIPLRFLRNMIRGRGEALSEFITKRVQPGVSNIREEAERQVDRVLGKTVPTRDELTRQLSELIEGSQRSVEELVRRVEERAKKAGEPLAQLTRVQSEFATLRSRLDEIERKLADISDPAPRNPNAHG